MVAESPEHQSYKTSQAKGLPHDPALLDHVEGLGPLITDLAGGLVLELDGLAEGGLDRLAGLGVLGLDGLGLAAEAAAVDGQFAEAEGRGGPDDQAVLGV